MADTQGTGPEPITTEAAVDLPPCVDALRKAGELLREQDAAILYVRGMTSAVTLPGGGRVYRRDQMISSFVAGIKWEQAKREKEGSET